MPFVGGNTPTSQRLSERCLFGFKCNYHKYMFACTHAYFIQPKLVLKSNQALPVLMPYILFVCSFIFFKIIARILNLDRSTTGALTITAGISSISFVGFPIFELLYGKEGVQMGILMSQAGSFVVCGTLGIMTASYYSSSEPSIPKIDF